MSASAVRSVYVPFGELKPDVGLFSNDGLVTAVNVVPAYGNYVSSNMWVSGADKPSTEALGLHTHFAGGTTWYGYLGSNGRLYEMSSALALTDKTRLAGVYAPFTGATDPGWHGASFGDAIIMTQIGDDPQLLTSPAAANFVKLAQSGGVNPGMDPKAKFVAPVKGNLFLANLNLAGAFDTLPAGNNPTVVAWSATDNVRQFGSYNVTPQLIGTGYQPLSYDMGHITGLIGGEYALIALQRGWVRADGPPYTFRPIVNGQGCRFPLSIVRLNNDVYFWGPAGPAMLPGGEGPPVTLGNDKITRTLIDNATDFSPTYALSSTVYVRHVSAAVDAANGLVFWFYTSVSGARATPARLGDKAVAYNVYDGRFSIVDVIVKATGAGAGVLFAQTSPDLGGTWSPGRDLVGVQYLDDQNGATVDYTPANYTYPAPTTITLTRAFQQLDSNATTRIRRVRPVYSRSAIVQTLVPTVSITSKNKPYATGSTSSSSTEDAHGWIVTPNTVFADFHQVGIVFTSTTQGTTETIVELEGLEYEYETGGRYSA
jgi:hypothetical protein